MPAGTRAGVDSRERRPLAPYFPQTRPGGRPAARGQGRRTGKERRGGKEKGGSPGDPARLRPPRAAGPGRRRALRPSLPWGQRPAPTSASRAPRCRRPSPARRPLTAAREHEATGARRAGEGRRAGPGARGAGRRPPTCGDGRAGRRAHSGARGSGRRLRRLRRRQRGPGRSLAGSFPQRPAAAAAAGTPLRPRGALWRREAAPRARETLPLVAPASVVAGGGGATSGRAGPGGCGPRAARPPAERAAGGPPGGHAVSTGAMGPPGPTTDCCLTHGSNFRAPRVLSADGDPAAEEPGVRPASDRELTHFRVSGSLPERLFTWPALLRRFLVCEWKPGSPRATILSPA